MTSSKLNKKVVVLIACLLLIVPATVAQSQSPQVRASAVCEGGRLTGINLNILQPGNYNLRFKDDVCYGTQRREVVV